MTPESLRLHIDAYLELRRSLGFHTPPQAHHLRELLDYVLAQGFSWPLRTQTILDWISAAAVGCGLPGQRMRRINARCFLKHLKASAPDTEVPGPGLLPRQPRPQPSFVLRRGDRYAPASHLPVMGTRFVVATDSLLDFFASQSSFSLLQYGSLKNHRFQRPV
jgi:hypothetical protein